MLDAFADTSGSAAFLIRTEPSHAAAEGLLRAWQAEGKRVVTTNYVLCELVALLMRFRMPRPLQVQAIDTIRAAPWVEVAHVDRSMDEAAWALLRTRLDKDWTLVDCASFALMQPRGIVDALTTDHHFEQAGFTALLR